MEGRLLNKSGILCSGKQFSKIRLPYAGADLIGFIYKGWDYPFQPNTSHANISVSYIGKYAANRQCRDTVLVGIKTKTIHILWKYRLDDYVNGGVLNLWQLQIDIDNTISVYAKGNLSAIFQLVLMNGKEMSMMVR